MSNFKKYRGLAGLTQGEAAEKLGMTRVGLASIEGGYNHFYVRKVTLDKMCELYGTTPIKLYGQDNFKVKPETLEEIDYMIEVLNKMKEALV